jgi:cytochrome c peroxidase
MHDGRFGTLEEVVEHYNSGVQNHPNLDNPLRRNGGVRRLSLSDAEKRALVAFLHTLSDYELAADPKFSDPFRSR